MGKRNKGSSNHSEVKKKKKEIISNELDKPDVTETEDTDQIQKTIEKRSKKSNKTKVSLEASKVKSEGNEMTVIKGSTSQKRKKKIFVDDEPHEITPSTTEKSVQNNTKKKFNEDEAGVTEEDIDKFIAELDNEDKVVTEQYDNWVKLIEAKLHSNKK